MNFKQFFFENNGKKLIICDVQPAYAKNIHFDLKEFSKFVSDYSNVLVLYNGPDLGFESKGQIANWYLRNGMKRETIVAMKFFEKNYNFFRDLMDEGYDRDSIIKVVRFLVVNKVNDWRDLSKEQIKIVSRRLGIDINQKFLETYMMSIPDLMLYIRKWNGSDIVGGGRHECLEEVLILMDALKLSYNVIQQFVY